MDCIDGMRKTKTDVKSIIKEKNRAEKKREMLNREWYSLRSILGNQWAIFYFLLGRHSEKPAEVRERNEAPEDKGKIV